MIVGKYAGKICLFADSIVDGVSIHSKILKNHKLRFKTVNGVRILQPPIKQRPGGKCAFAAVARQIEYNLRMLYANSCKAEPPVSVHGCFIDDKKWEEDLRKRYPQKLSRWRPSELYHEAINSEVPLWNGGYHMIQHSKLITKKKEDLITMLKQVLNQYPVIGIFEVNSSFSEDGGMVYIPNGKKIFEKIKTNDGKTKVVEAFHSVVLVDCCECDGVTYVAYQNSRGDPSKSMCELGISWLEISCIEEIGYGCSLPPVHPPSCLQTKEQVELVIYDINRVAEGSNDFKSYLEKGRLLIQELGDFCRTGGDWEKMKDEFHVKLREVQSYIEKIRRIHMFMKYFMIKYEFVERAAAVGVLNVSSNLGICRESITAVERAGQELRTAMDKLNRQFPKR